ncbi:MAG TPA: alpha/beta hydrolase [Ohtaekwangia sp.]|nr:alpha/beta hydrolase [Ohtaekwangia sp.]
MLFRPSVRIVLLSILLTGCVMPPIVHAQAGDEGHPRIPLDTTYTVASTYRKLIKNYPYIQPVEPFQLETILQQENVTYLALEDTPFGKRDLHVDIFAPKNASGSYPAILLIHGGGWRAGNKSLNTPMAQQLAAHGFVVLSVEYRLSLEAKYPAALHDIKAAIRWTRAHAKKYNVDPARVAIGGSSAGGQLSALIGATNGNKKYEGTLCCKGYASDVQAVIDMDGLLDFTDPESLALKRTENSADVFWLQGFYEDIPDKWREASALYTVSKSAPPFLFINSSQTRFHAGCSEMVKKLDSYGIYSEVHKLEGSPHSYWLFHPWFEPTIRHITGFLGKVFATTEPAR